MLAQLSRRGDVEPESTISAGQGQGNASPPSPEVVDGARTTVVPSQKDDDDEDDHAARETELVSSHDPPVLFYTRGHISHRKRPTGHICNAKINTQENLSWARP